MRLTKPRELHDIEFWQQLDREEILLHDRGAWRKLDQLQHDLRQESTKEDEHSDISTRREEKQKRKTISKLLKFKSYDSEASEKKKKKKNEMLEKYFQQVKQMYIEDLKQKSEPYPTSTSSNVY